MKSGTLFLFHHHKIGNRRSFNETVNSYLSWTKRSSLSFLFQVVLRSFVSRTAANIIQKTHISLVYTQSMTEKITRYCITIDSLRSNSCSSREIMLPNFWNLTMDLNSPCQITFGQTLWNFDFLDVFLPWHKQTNEFNFFRMTLSPFQSRV